MVALSSITVTFVEIVRMVVESVLVLQLGRVKTKIVCIMDMAIAYVMRLAIYNTVIIVTIT